MASTTETATIVNAVNNNGLFSNRYLEDMIQKVPEWNDDARLRETFMQIKEIFDRKGKNFEKYVEADLEHNLIRPVFDKLGHYYGVQESVHHDPLKPDYAFFPDRMTLDEAYSHKKDTEGFYKKAVVVGDAKAWNVALDKSRQGKAQRDMANPSYQIDNYLRATPAKWAILTNGRLWRLYHEDTSVKMDCYYEVNLPEMISRIEASGDITLFKYFYLFFRLEAFPQLPLGSSFLDRVREESAAYAQKVGNDLQENVYKAMKVLAEGFFAEKSNSLSHSLEDIKDVQENSMRLLYRLLFIFYAESRKLLNTDKKQYWEMSLRKLKEEIAQKIDQGETILAVRSTYWEGLRDLFRLINDGSEAFGYPKDEFFIPAYNGGLFDPLKNPFLTQKKIGNSYLAEAIDLLARSQSDGKMVFVDYSSLDIRHLGSIYEGILEYKLHLAGEPMVAVKEKGKEVWLPAEKAGKKFSERVEAGGLYLVTDKGERKATGSYYTPEYIVKYIVKNTLAPLIDPMMEEAMWSEDLRKGLLKKLLSIKVLDPAMGSGHFLVEATDYIAREIIHAKEIARHEDLESEEIAENDIHWARREVVRNCIYGVDLNHMAVELAKLSLWLTTVASNKPLSFLDHHLRNGNSLIGAELKNLTVLPGRDAAQPPMWGFVIKGHTDKLLSKYSLMAALPDDTLQMVKWKEDQFRQIKASELSKRLNELSNVWLSTFFGNKVKDEDYYELQNHLSPEKFPDWAGLRKNDWFEQAQEIADKKRFFHWELEFPEAFQGERRGFDVVIGNPPYDILIRSEQGSDLINYVNTKYYAAEYNPNLFAIFTELSIELAKINGFVSLIMPSMWLTNSKYTNVRSLLVNHTQLRTILDLQFTVFKEIIPTSVFVTTKIGCQDDELVKIGINKKDHGKLPSKYVEITQSRLESKLLDGFGDFISDEPNILKESLLSHIDNYYTVYRGVETRDNGKYLSNEKRDELDQPILNATDVERYGCEWSGLYVRFVPEELKSNADINMYRVSKKVLLRRTGDTLISCVDVNGYLATKNLYLLIPKANLSAHFLCVVLNSQLMNWERIRRTRDHGQAFAQLKGTDIASFPIRRISFTTPAPERARLGAELQQLYADDKFADILAQVEACLPKDEAGNFIESQEKSDVVHDLLAFLAERMLEMNKQKQQEIKGFLGWLEGYVGAKVEDLTPKTKLQSYYEHDFAGFLAVLKKNKTRLAIDPARRKEGDDLKAEFEGSLGKLGPLRERIEKTDRLIDAVVYRLYGLTKEEIAIVEGRETAK